ncbi:MAG: ABC transporter ATP-binding protein/permease [Lachnospiraceae bacterium]|nr:ABC transporter ATP-binding protein/permease [Lachnospiraceae bacterium]
MKNTTFSFLMKYVFKKWYWVIGSVFFSALTVAGSLFIPKFTGKGVDMVIEKGNVDFFSLKQIIVYILILIGVTIVSQLLLSLINNRLTAGVVSEIRKDAMQKIHRLPISYVDSHPQGDLVSRMIADVETLSDGLLMGFTQFFTGVLTILGTLVLMVIMDWRITVVVVIVTPLSFFVAGFVSKRTYSLFQKQTEARSTQVSFINEMVSNQKVVRAFGKEEENIEKFEKMNRALKDASLKATFYSSLTNPSTRFVNALVYAGVAIFGAMAIVTKGLLSIGELTVFLSYANQYTKPFNEISGVITEFQNALACADRIREFLNEKEEVPFVESTGEESIENKEGEGSKAAEQAEKSAECIKEFNDLEFKNVYFSYTEKQKLIEDFSLKVEKGLRVAIVGPTGCGKTTLINLIMRFYDVNAGEILMNGINIQKFDRKDYRDNFGMVLQETWLRKGSVRDNITLGRDISDEEVINACRECHAHRFIERMKDGYNTQISEDGGNLSNGQKQLLCISRVMLMNPPILILDEATSSIDTRTELKVQDAFAKLMKGKTSFIVAHRLSTIKNADVILVMKDGNIIEQGSHEELIKAGGFYKELYMSQWANEEESE